MSTEYVVLVFNKDKEVLRAYGPFTSEWAGIVFRGLSYAEGDFGKVEVLRNPKP